MLQQQVCFVHIRLSIASGHVVPDITFKSSLLLASRNQSGEPENLNLASNKTQDYISAKEEKSFHIALEKLDENDLRETLLKLKGFRYDRDLLIETYALQNQKMNKTNEDINSSKKTKKSPRKSSHNSGEMSNKSKRNVDNAADKHAKLPQTYAACVSGSIKKEENVQKISSNEQSADEPTSTNPKELKTDSDSKVDRRASLTSESRLDASVSTDSHTSSNSKYQFTSVPFFSGNPAVDITNGIIHLYKTNYKVPVGEDAPPPPTNTLFMLSVPASIDTHNLLEFIAPYMEVIHQMRIIRDRTPNQYMVLLTFISEKDACEFFLNLNSQPFSSLLPEEICRLAFVASVEALAPPGTNEMGKDERFLPIPNSTELPDCMVCLERMDESVQGLLTVLCNHSFHAACLQQWEDLCCPVCRYVQTPEPRNDNKCMVCGASEDLWICLVCGNVGCGRYTKEHAQRHYLETYHNYAMSLTDNRVWDYAGDYFVHRLFQNKDDGKLVEKNSSQEHEAKLEGVQLECMHLLTSQLESQRKYWEDQVGKVEKVAADQQEEATTQLQQVNEKNVEMQTKVSFLEKEKKNSNHRFENLSSKLREALRDLSNEREMNKSLTENQNVWKDKVKELEDRCGRQEAELKDLKDQLRDVMFYIEASQKIKNENESVRNELRDGQVVVGPSSSSNESSRSRGKPKKRTR